MVLTNVIYVVQNQDCPFSDDLHECHSSVFCAGLSSLIIYHRMFKIFILSLVMFFRFSVNDLDRFIIQVLIN